LSRHVSARRLWRAAFTPGRPAGVRRAAISMTQNRIRLLGAVEQRAAVEDAIDIFHREDCLAGALTPGADIDISGIWGEHMYEE
jgi:hypothetical protein